MATRTPKTPAKKPAAKKTAAKKPATKNPATRKARAQPAANPEPSPAAAAPVTGAATLRNTVQPVPQAVVPPQPLHTRLVHDLAVGPDGVAYSAGEDGLVLAFDARTLEVKLKFVGHDGPVNTLALSEDGRMLVTGGDDRTVRLWDTATGTCTQTMTGHEGYVRHVAICGDRIASGSEDDLLKLWHRDPGYCLATVAHPEDVMVVALSPDGQRVATASLDNAVRVYDATTGALVRTVYDAGSWVSRLPGMESLFIAGDNTTGRGHHGTPVRMLFSADSQTLYTAENDVLAWDLASDDVRTVLPSNGWACRGLALQGDVLAAGSYGVRLANARTGEALAPMAHGVDQITALAFDRDGLLVGQDKGPVSRWPAAPTAAPGASPHAGSINEIAVDAQSKRAAVRDMFNVVSLWDLATGTCTAVFDDLPQANGCALAFSPDGARLAMSRDMTIHVRDTSTGARLHSLKFAVEGEHCSPSALAFEPGGTLLVGSSLKSLTRWHLDGTGRIEKLDGLTGQVSKLLLSDDGKVALSQGYFGDDPEDFQSNSARLQCWDVSEMKLRWTERYPPYEAGKEVATLTMMALSADGQTVWASDPQEMKAFSEWSASGGEGTTHALEAGYGQGGLLTDGRLWLATAVGTGDEHQASLHLWTAGADEPEAAAPLPIGHAVSGVSADGAVALLRRGDHTIFWDVAKGEPVSQVVDAGIRQVELAPDGQVAVAGDALGRVWVVGRDRSAP